MQGELSSHAVCYPCCFVGHRGTVHGSCNLSHLLQLGKVPVSLLLLVVGHASMDAGDSGSTCAPLSAAAHCCCGCCCRRWVCCDEPAKMYSTAAVAAVFVGLELVSQAAADLPEPHCALCDAQSSRTSATVAALWWTPPALRGR